MRRRPPAEQGALPGGQHRGEVRGLDTGRLVADSMHPSMDPNQVAPPQPPPDLPARDARIEQLCAGHDPMPRTRDPRYSFFDRPA